MVVGYKAIIDKYWPRGIAWPRDMTTLQGKLRAALVNEFDRFDARVQNLFDEIDPRATSELLPDWERMLAIPDNCSGVIPNTIELRRDAVITKLKAIGGATPQYFIDLAASHGFEIEIQEFSMFSCESFCEEALYDEPWAYSFRVIAPSTTVRDMTCESYCTEYLRTWENAVLECLINRYKPAHLFPIFQYAA